jgi:hypothetical protein
LTGAEAEGSDIPAAVPMQNLTPQVPEATEGAPELMEEATDVTSRIFPECYCLQKCEFQNFCLNLSAYLNYKDVFF